MKKVLGTKVKYQTYMQFVEKAKLQETTQSQLLRNLIISSIETHTERPIDRLIILKECLKVLYEIQTKMRDIVSASKLGLMDYLNMQIADFERKLEFEEQRFR